MNSNKLYDNALLAQASYADFENVKTKDEVETALQAIDKDNPENSFSKTQAEYFTEHWEIARRAQ